MNCNQHLLVTALLIEGEPELISTEIQQVYTLTLSILYLYKGICILVYQNFCPFGTKFGILCKNFVVMTVNANVSTCQFLKLLTINKSHNKTIGAAAPLSWEELLVAPSNSNNETLTKILTLFFPPFWGEVTGEVLTWGTSACINDHRSPAH